MICSVCCMGIRLDAQEKPDTDTSYIYWALLVGTIPPCLMSTKHFAVRKFKENYGAIAQSIDGFVLEYFLFSCITILLMNDDSYSFSWRDLGVGTGAGVLMCFGRTFISIAV
jgi:hypothetical protein